MGLKKRGLIIKKVIFDFFIFFSVSKKWRMLLYFTDRAYLDSGHRGGNKMKVSLLGIVVALFVPSLCSASNSFGEDSREYQLLDSNKERVVEAIKSSEDKHIVMDIEGVSFYINIEEYFGKVEPNKFGEGEVRSVELERPDYALPEGLLRVLWLNIEVVGGPIVLEGRYTPKVIVPIIPEQVVEFEGEELFFNTPVFDELIKLRKELEAPFSSSVQDIVDAIFAGRHEVYDNVSGRKWNIVGIEETNRDHGWKPLNLKEMRKQSHFIAVPQDLYSLQNVTSFSYERMLNSEMPGIIARAAKDISDKKNPYLIYDGDIRLLHLVALDQTQEKFKRLYSINLKSDDEANMRRLFEVQERERGRVAGQTGAGGLIKSFTGGSKIALENKTIE
jgi:hypothetical protein